MTKKTTAAKLLGSLLLAGLALTACSAQSTPAASGSSGASGDCGTIPAKPPTDEAGILTALGEEYQSAFEGYGMVRSSTWSEWDPGAGPYQVGIVMADASSPFQEGTLSALEAGLKADPNVSEVITRTVEIDPTAQLSAYNQLVDEGVDVIVVQPLVAESFIPAIERAAEANIPTISLYNTTPTEDVINVAPNLYLMAAETAAAVVESAGGSGSILGVHAIQGNPADVTAFEAFNDVFGECPDIEMAGEVTANFDPAMAKSETLKFLATNPAPIGGVVQTAGMTSGIISAFEEAGREVPTVTDAGEKSTLAFWRENVDSGYTGTASIMGPEHLGDAGARVIGRLLAGQRPLTADIIGTVPTVTNETLDDWVDASWTTTTPGLAEGTGDYFLPDSYLDGLFTPAS